MMRNSFVQPQNQLMQRKNIIRFSLIAAVLLGSFLLLHGTGSAKQEAVCRESMPRSGSAGGMIWENVSSSIIFLSASN
jgi:hypothetical protein